MSSPVEICNRALGFLGQPPITALTDDSVAARLCLNEYQPCADDLLQEHDWNCASVRAASLVPLATNPFWDYAFAFQLPADPYCLRVRETSEDSEGRWAVEGRTLVADVSTLSIRYTARILEGTFPPRLATAIAYELATRLAWPLTGKQAQVESNAKLAQMSLSKAKALDGQEGTPRVYVTSALTRVRVER